jgi:SAM-dependent methyltransferase
LHVGSPSLNAKGGVPLSVKLITMGFMRGRPRANLEAQRRFVGGAMRMTIVAVFAAAFTMSVSAQDFMAGPGTLAVAFPKPDRPVADIISPIWHDEKERDDAGEPTQLVRLLGIKSGMTVADIGAGSGYYVVRLSPIVGPRGRIIAQDVVPEYLRGLRSRVRDLGLQNVVISLGEPHDPRLPADSLNIAIMVHMYHEIAQPYALLYNLVPALKPGARVGIIDAYGPTSEHGTPPDLLRCELAAVGYREISLDGLTGSDAYLAIFAPPSVASRTRPEVMVACKARHSRLPMHRHATLALFSGVARGFA